MDTNLPCPLSPCTSGNVWSPGLLSRYSFLAHSHRFQSHSLSTGRQELHMGYDPDAMSYKVLGTVLLDLA